MTIPSNKVSLSHPRKQLLQLMQEVNFGRIESLVIRGGEPVFDPGPSIVREIKFGGENGSRLECHMDDFRLRIQVIELFEHLSGMGNAIVRSLEVKHGLPFRMIVEESLPG